PGASDSRSPRLQKIDWDKDGMPVLGTPQKEEEPMARPSGSPIHKKQN
ncbi:glycosyl hydrolase family 43, partial [Bacteroides thetaiotaomicron]